MNERNGYEAIHEGSEVVPEAWVSIQEAARTLGISERAVHLRVKAGTLKRRQTGKRVQIAVPASEAVHEAQAENSEGFHEVSEVLQNDLIEQLRSEVTFLRSQIEATNIEKAELRRLMLADRQEIAELRQRLALVAAPEPTPEGPQSSEKDPPEREASGGPLESTRRPWWQVWKR